MEYLLIVNHFIPKSATRLTAGLASTAMRRFLCISFSQIRAIDFTLVPPFLRGARGDQTQQLATNPLKTLQHLNIRKPDNFQSIPL
jgi:hypothetical protein